MFGCAQAPRPAAVLGVFGTIAAQPVVRDSEARAAPEVVRDRDSVVSADHVEAKGRDSAVLDVRAARERALPVQPASRSPT